MSSLNFYYEENLECVNLNEIEKLNLYSVQPAILSPI